MPIVASPRQVLWFALLFAASVAFSLGFACAVPFAAFGAIAALTLPRRGALLLAVAVWLANQVVGFACLGYPATASALAWGGAFGVVAVLTTLAAQATARRLAARGAVLVPLVAFACAFLVYEGSLFVVAATLLGGTATDTPATVARILAINATAFVGLLVLRRIVLAGRFATQRPLGRDLSGRLA
jgi:hypothetical protein